MNEISVIDLIASDAEPCTSIIFYECDFCTKYLKSREELKKHLEQHICSDHSCTSCQRHQGKGENENLLSDSKNEIEGVIQSHHSRFKEEMKQSTALDCHVQSFHKQPPKSYVLSSKYSSRNSRYRDGNKNLITKNQTFQCRSVSSTSALARKHVYFCVECDVAFSRKCSLRRHERTHFIFSSQQSFQCNECGITFANKFNLERHEKLHSSFKPCVCQICKISFFHKYYLETHLLSHSVIQRFECKECKKAYKTRWGLIKHKKTHK